jgi:hypothetical protein
MQPRFARTVGRVIDYAALEREARRIYFRFATEVVESLTFCPWARDARETGRVDCRVIFGTEPTLEHVLSEVLAAGERSDIDVTLLVMPEAQLGRVALRHFTGALHSRYESACGRGQTPLAIADFHPDTTPDLATPGRLVPFVRSSPDPTLQLIRHSALQAAQRGPTDGTKHASLEMMLAGSIIEEPAHARIAAANFKTVKRVGTAHVLALLADIAADRSASYAKLGVPTTAWDRTSGSVSNSPDASRDS